MAPLVCVFVSVAVLSHVWIYMKGSEPWRANLLNVCYMQYVQVSVIPVIPATGHVYDISIPDSFMYIPALSRS